MKNDCRVRCDGSFCATGGAGMTCFREGEQRSARTETKFFCARRLRACRGGGDYARETSEFLRFIYRVWPLKSDHPKLDHSNFDHQKLDHLKLDPSYFDHRIWTPHILTTEFGPLKFYH
jgi:hypothetical protein